jgi:hypothetical protein
VKTRTGQKAQTSARILAALEAIISSASASRNGDAERPNKNRVTIPNAPRLYVFGTNARLDEALWKYRETGHVFRRSTQALFDAMAVIERPATFAELRAIAGSVSRETTKRTLLRFEACGVVTSSVDRDGTPRFELVLGTSRRAAKNNHAQ